MLNRFSVLVLNFFMSLPFVKNTVLAIEVKPENNVKFLSGVSGVAPDVGAHSKGSSSNAEVSPIEKFASAFTKEVYSSDELSGLFNLTETTPSVFSKFLYNDAMAILLKHDIPEPQRIADSLAQPIAEIVDVFTLNLVVSSYANAMAKFLFDEHVLNASNVNTLASRYAKEMQKYVILNENSITPESKLKALPDGYTNFLKSLHIFVPEKFAEIASGFGNEMKLQFGK